MAVGNATTERAELCPQARGQCGVSGGMTPTSSGENSKATVASVLGVPFRLYRAEGCRERPVASVLNISRTAVR